MEFRVLNGETLQPSDRDTVHEPVQRAEEEQAAAVGKAELRSLEIGWNADRDQVRTQAVELLHRLIGDRPDWSYEQIDRLTLLVDELAVPVVNHPEADGVLVATRLAVNGGEALCLDLRVRGAHAAWLGLIADYADHHGIEYDPGATPHGPCSATGPLARRTWLPPSAIATPKYPSRTGA